MNGKWLGGFAVMAAALCATAPAHAAVTFDFKGTSNSAFDGPDNARPFSAGGIDVIATAWSTRGLNNSVAADLPVQSWLGQYVNGLGVTNDNEGDGKTNNSHAVDNVGSYDFIRLEFSKAVTLTGLLGTLYPVTGGTAVDNGIWISHGTGSSTAFNTNALWKKYLDYGVAYTSDFSNPNFSKVWLVGAARSQTDRDDGFKLAGVIATAQSVVPVVPEPTTWLTMIVGFGLMGGTLRRRGSSPAAGAATV